MPNNTISGYFIPDGWTDSEVSEGLLNTYEEVIAGRDPAHAAEYIWAPHLRIALSAARERNRKFYYQQPEETSDDIERVINLAGSDSEQIKLMMELTERIANRSFLARTGALDLEGNTGYEMNFINPRHTFEQTGCIDLLRMCEKDDSGFDRIYTRVLKRDGVYLIEKRSSKKWDIHEDKTSTSEYFLIDLNSQEFKTLATMESNCELSQHVLTCRSAQELHQTFTGVGSSCLHLSRDGDNRQLTARSSGDNELGIIITPQQRFTHFYIAALTLHMFEQRQYQ